MLRSGLILTFAVLALALSGGARAAVTVFQDPACNLPGCTVGTPGAPAVPITAVAPATVALNLFYQAGTVPSTVPANRCHTGDGDEVCGWDIHISTTSPDVVLQSFVPDTGPGSDVVAAISGNVLRANGGIPTDGELGIHRIGTLYVQKANSSATGSVTVAGNLFVTSALAASPVTSGNILATATAGGPDFDGDGVDDSIDNCPTVANAGQEDGAGGLEVPADGVGDACDNCTNATNARVTGWTLGSGGATFLAANPWATLTGGQRDDDHDGFGNRCDADFTAAGALVGTNDLTQYRASSGKSRLGDTCGTAGDQPCARYDLDEAGALINTADLAVYRGLSGKAAGPKCAACAGAGSVPLPCEAGTAGACN
jgi:hypothetical protein